MTINPHLSDQLAALAAEAAVTSPPPIDFAPTIIEMIRQEMPGADEKLVGEIVMHTASIAARLAWTLEQRNWRPDAIAPLVSSALAQAGAVLYRGGAS